MSFAAPWAVIGFVVLPLIYWLHKRKSKPRVVDLPTLLFLVDEDEREHQPRTRRLDLESVLAMCTAALLTLAAIGPQLEGGEPVRRVRVVVAAGPLLKVKGYELRALDVYADIPRAVSKLGHARRGGRQLEVVYEPEGGNRRASDDDLLAAARAAPAAVRIVVSDRLPTIDTGDVHWVAIGDPEAANVGIVAVDVTPKDDGYEVFGTVINDSSQTATVGVTFGAIEKALGALEPGAFRSFSLTTPSIEPKARLVCTSDLPADHQPADDEIDLDPRPTSVWLDPQLPAALATAIRNGLMAAVGAQGFDESDDAEIRFTISRSGGHRDAIHVMFQPIGDDRIVRSAGGIDVVHSHPFTRDLSARSADLHYVRGAEVVHEAERLLLGLGGRRIWPVLIRDRDNRKFVRFAPDPTRGSPALVDTPFWPLFMQNLVGGHATSAGVRVHGVLDADASRLGRDVSPFDNGWITSAKPDVVPPPTSLRMPLLLLGLLCLFGLWMLPVLRARHASPTQAVGQSV